MIKNIVLFISSVLLGLIIIIFGYVFFYHQKITVLNPFLPSTQFSLENAPSESLTGQIASYSGNVAWESRTANFAVLINSKIKLQQGEEVIAQGNGLATIIFPDSTTISLSNNSQVNLIQTLPADLVIEQTQGTVDYKKTDGKIPLSVRALDLLINISSGETLVTLNKVTQKITVTVEKGNITAAYTDNQNNTQVVNFSKGDSFIFNNNDKEYSIQTP